MLILYFLFSYFREKVHDYRKCVHTTCLNVLYLLNQKQSPNKKFDIEQKKMDLTILAPILWPLPNLVSVIRNNKSTENKAEVNFKYYT